jgi:hypothetical protein
MNDRRKREAIAAARSEIARRLARICSTLPPEEFERLLDRMAGLQWKYDVLPFIPHGDTGELSITGEHTAEHTAERPIPRQKES